MTAQFLDVTEIEGQQASGEQVARMCHRYHWAAKQCRNLDILEVACGAGPGLRILQRAAKSLHAGDYSPEVLSRASGRFGDVSLSAFSAESLPFADRSFDRILLFEALYYVETDDFFAEARRVLRPGGALLLVTANKDLYDFTPSPHAKRYLGAAELARELANHGFEVTLAGYLDVSDAGLRQRVLRPLKALATRLGMMPKTMHGKERLKKLFFGSLTAMPADISEMEFDYIPPTPLGPVADRRHKVIYCRADLRQEG
jgi:SAM-dependent methyltransferase